MMFSLVCNGEDTEIYFKCSGMLENFKQMSEKFHLTLRRTILARGRMYCSGNRGTF